MPRPPRLLIVRIGAMGDILHALPAVAGLRRVEPGAHIAWLIEPTWLPLLASSTGVMPLVDAVHLADTRAWKHAPFAPATLRDLHRLARELAAARYDHVVDLQGSIRSAALSRLARAPHLTGPAPPREQPAGLFYKQHVPLHAANVIDQAAELLSAALDTRLPLAPALLPEDPEPQPAQPPFVLIAPTAGWGAKQWPIPHYIALVQALAARGHRVLINTSSPITAAAAAIAQATGAALAQTSLPALIALTRQAALVIGGDTGPMHLGAALGRPTLALFGPTDPARNGPAFPGANVRILRHPSSRTDHRRHPATEAGLEKVTVEEVLAAALALLHPQGV